MEIRYPNYYKKFQCIAGDCPDTCCAGWEIPVDGARDKRYRAAVAGGPIQNKAFARKLKKHIRQGRIINEDVTCPFLNEDRLCEMYLELGPESLCHTCKRHPRHLEDYGNLHEMVLLLSCPEVARLVIEENDGGFYTRDLPERQGNMDGIDEELLEALLQVREVIWAINRDDTMTIHQRMAYALSLGHDVQRRIRNKELEQIGNVLQTYTRNDAPKRFLAQWKMEGSKRLSTAENCAETGSFLLDTLQDTFSNLEPIYRDWKKLMGIPLGNGEPEKQTEDPDQPWSHVFEYYVYSFVLSALYDEDLLSKVKMAVCCTLLSRELYCACKQRDPETDLADICHAVARQIENSDSNRQTLEQSMKQKAFGSRRIIHVLLNR